MNNLKIKNKLILMLIFPIAGLLYFSFDGIRDKSRLSREMDKLQTLSTLVIKISEFIHESQKERGETGVFMGSKGTEYTTELQAQRSETDNKITVLEGFLKNFDSNQVGTEFKNDLDSALNMLNRIKSHRDAVNALSIHPSEGIGYYTDMNASFLKVIEHISKLSTNAEVSTIVYAYVNFLKGKEKTGVERAIMSNTFGVGKFGKGVFDKFISAISVQDIYINQFLFLATSDQSDFYKNKIQGQFIDETARMRNIALEKAEQGNFGVDPAYWYTMMTGKINLLKEIEGKLSNDLNLKAEQLKNNAQSVLTFYMVVTVVAIMASLVLAYISMCTITNPLSKMIESSQKIAAGDLSIDVQVRSKDEVGTLANAFRKMAANLREMLENTKELATNVSTAVKTIGDSASSIKRGSEDQATAMTEVSLSVEGVHKMAIDVANSMEQLLRVSEDTSSSILEMTASIEAVDGNVASLAVAVEDISASIGEIAASLKEVASGIDYISKGADETVASLVQIDASAAEIEGHTKEVAELSDEVTKEGERGVKAVEITHAGMEKIKEEVKQLAMVINELGQRSEEIGKILNVINDVTDETTLLALNAAILAAQAGEHGRGFSVVAEEIRELSDKTAASTREITGIISGIQGQIKKALESVKEGIGKVMEGEKLSMETIGVLERIMERFRAFRDKSVKIARATQEQAKGSKQVTQSLEAITSTIHQMARATQEQSQGSTQIVKAVERVKEVASQIKRATAEQTEGSKVIASNTEKMMRFIQERNVASSDQEKESQKIATAVIKTATVAGAGMENAGQLEEVIDALRKEVETLKQGLERFKLE